MFRILRNSFKKIKEQLLNKNIGDISNEVVVGQFVVCFIGNRRFALSQRNACACEKSTNFPRTTVVRTAPMGIKTLSVLRGGHLPHSTRARERSAHHPAQYCKIAQHLCRHQNLRYRLIEPDGPDSLSEINRQFLNDMTIINKN